MKRHTQLDIQNALEEYAETDFAALLKTMAYPLPLFLIGFVVPSQPLRPKLSIKSSLRSWKNV